MKIFRTILLSFTLILGIMSIAPSAHAELDTDRDGYSDQLEIKNNYDPYSPCGKNVYDQKTFAYGKGRLTDRSDEGCRAKFLKSELEAILGKGKLNIQAKNWHTVVNAFIYGGYTPEDIATVVKSGARTVHPSIPKHVWMNSKDYKTDMHIPEVGEVLGVKITMPENTYQKISNNGNPYIVETTKQTKLNNNTILFGYVYDNLEKNTLANTKISLYKYTNPEQTTYTFIDSTITDTSGFYQLSPKSLSSIAGKNVFVLVEKTLYNKSEYKFAYNRDEIKNVDFKLTNRNQFTPTVNQPLVYTDINPVDRVHLVRVLDKNKNPLPGINVTVKMDEDNIDGILLHELSGVTDRNGYYVIKGEWLDGRKDLNASIYIEHPLIADESKTINIKRKGNTEFTPFLTIPGRDQVSRDNHDRWKNDLIVSHEVYTNLYDPRNVNELEITVIDKNTQQPITNYSVLDIASYGLIDFDGKINEENIEEGLYFGRIIKENSEKSSGYDVNSYFRVYIPKYAKTNIMLFVDTSDVINYL